MINEHLYSIIPGIQIDKRLTYENNISPPILKFPEVKKKQGKENLRSQNGRMGGRNGLVKSSKQETNLSGLQLGKKLGLAILRRVFSTSL